MSSTSKSSDGHKGFFKKIRFRRKTKGSNKSLAKDLSVATEDSNQTANNDGPILLTRRVIKATRPPSPTTEMGSMVSSSDQDTMGMDSSSSSGNERSHMSAVPSPSVLDENLREKTEQWRKERFNATAAMQKENKEKEIMQHRLSKVEDKDGGGSATDGGEEQKKAEKIPELEVSDIFKTRTFHPEHKRKGHTDDQGGKKTKIDDGEEKEGNEAKDSLKCEENRLSERSSILKIPGWISIVAPAAIAAACAFGVVMMKALRKR